MYNYSILVNTCDKFEDCWDPFFKLWSLYWQDCHAKIYLNTEYKDYKYTGVEVTPIRGCVGKKTKGKPATWSQCLRWALEKVDTDIILYMQEDYFLNAPVDNQKVEHYVKYMNENNNISCIQLTIAGIPDGDVANEKEYLNYSNSDYFCYVCCQASLWKKQVLLELIRDHESAWNFEWYGSKRAKYIGLKFLTVDHEWLRDGNHIIPYVATGIIGGKWNKKIIELFEKHDIKVDFNKRGFVPEIRNKSLFQRLLFKINFVKVRSEIEVFLLRLKQIRTLLR